MHDEFEHGFAMVVGVANYQHASKLPESVLNDARDFESVLKSRDYCGYPSNHVELFLDGNATAVNIRKGLQNLAHSARVNDTAIVFFSGHGGRVDTGSEAGTYLLPFDYDPGNIKGTAIRADEFTTLLSQIAAERLVVLLDACHSGGAGTPKALDPTIEIKAGLDEKTYSLLARGVGRVIVASSRTTEVSLVLPGMRNSLFSHHLLDALRGASVIRGDGLVRVLDVFHYVADKVPTQASQHPIFKAHDLEANFPLALYRGGKRVVQQAVTPVGLAPRPVTITGKARLEIRRGLVSRWVDLADYVEVPLPDRFTIQRGADPAGNLIDWLEERRKLGILRDAFNYLGWDDLIEVLNQHPR